MRLTLSSLVLTLAMVLSVVRVTALAAGDTPVRTVESDGTSGVKVIKTATPEKNGNGKATINMEAYVTGKVTTTTQYIPLDIVLVLDQSRSMKDNLSQLKSAATDFIKTITEDATTHSVDHRIAVVGFASDRNDYPNYQNTELFVGKTQYNYNELTEATYKKAFQTVTNEEGKSNLTQSIENLAANGGTHPELGMEMANGIFAANPNTTGTRQRIVVMFTDGEPGDQGFDDAVANATVAQAYTTKDTYHATVYTVGLISDPGDKVTKFLSKVSSNYPDAQAYEEYIYSPVYAGQLDKNSKYYVESGNSYEEVQYYKASVIDDVSGWYLDGAWYLPGTKYTPKTDANDKNKKHTQFYSRQETTAKDNKYYMHTGNAGGLNNIFTNIAKDTTHANVEVGDTSEMRDELSNFFVFDGGVTVKKVAAQGSGNEPAWASEGKDITNDVTVKVVDDKITVTGFDYSSVENCVVKKDGESWKGYKLVLSFNVTPNVNCYDWKEEKNYDTNKTTAGSQAGLYYGDSDSTVVNGSPQVPVPTYQVIYDWGTSGVTTDVTDSQHFMSGQTAQVLYSTVVKGAAVKGTNDQLYRFNGWSLDDETLIEKSVNIIDSNVTLKPVLTKAYTVTYTDGVEEEVFADQVYSNLISGDATPVFNGTPTRNGYQFTGWDPTVAEKVTGNAVYTAQWEKEEVLYTLIFDANGGAWSGTTVDGYTVSEGKASRSGVSGTEQITSTSITPPTNQGKVLDGWGYYDNGKLIKISNLDYPIAYAPTVKQLYDKYGQKPTNTVTLYAIWKDEASSADSLTYTINQHYIRSETDADNIQIDGLSSEKETEISKLIKGKDEDLDWRDGHGSLNHYAYVASETTVTVPGQTAQPYNTNDTLRVTGTVIDLYYYLDDWKDADETTASDDEDSATGGDGIPDCQQVKIVYEAFEQSNGTVTPTIEIATIENGKLNKVNGSTATANTGFAFATWTDVDVEVTKDNVNSLATKLGNKKCTPNIATPTGNKTYTYTAIFLKDEVGGNPEKEGADKPDNIPDAWQYKVTFKVLNANWNDQTSADVVRYEPNKDTDGTACAKGTEGSKATLDGVTIPVAGSQPDSGYKASGNWNTTPSATTVINKEDTVFTYTYDKKSGGSGGSGGSHKPTVTIPDDVPTGLNGKDHYAYVVGYPDGMVYPQKNITRAEVATIFFRLLKDETREANMTKSNSYNDMKDGAWYTCAVSTLSKMGIIKGYEDGSFKPDASISRAEFAAIAARFDPDGDKTPATFSDVSSHWAKDEISIAANHGWIKGYEDGSFKPDQKITRAETMTLVNRVLKRLPETKDDLHKDMKTWPDNQNESAWFYLAVQEATNSHYQKLKKDGTHETWESMRETRDWAALEK